MHRISFFSAEKIAKAVRQQTYNNGCTVCWSSG